MNTTPYPTSYITTNSNLSQVILFHLTKPKKKCHSLSGEAFVGARTMKHILHHIRFITVLPNMKNERRTASKNQVKFNQQMK